MPKKKKNTLRIRQVRSLIGVQGKMRETVRGLGLRRIDHEVTLEDTPAVRGMIAKVSHIVHIVEGESK